MDVSDSELAQALIDERPWAPRAAVQRFSPLVRGVLRRGLGASQELEDAQQEVFLCVFRRVSSLRNLDALRGFVTGIALRTVLVERRRRKKRERMLLEEEPLGVDLEQSRATTAFRFAWARLEQMLGRLRERERLTFVLRFIERRTTSEVAEALSLSIATARRSFSRAWQRVTTWAARDPFLADYLARNLTLPLH